MSEQVIPVDECTHPEVSMRINPANYHENLYECNVCHKKIAIPLSTVMVQSGEDIRNIFFMTFGWDTK
jgi:hypothetical protein